MSALSQSNSRLSGDIINIHDPNLNHSGIYKITAEKDPSFPDVEKRTMGFVVINIIPVIQRD